MGGFLLPPIAASTCVDASLCCLATCVNAAGGALGQHIAESDQLVHLVRVSGSGGGASSSAAGQQPQAQAAPALRESDRKLAQQLPEPVQQQTWPVGLWRPKSGQDSRQQVRREGHGWEHVRCGGGCAAL